MASTRVSQLFDKVQQAVVVSCAGLAVSSHSSLPSHPSGWRPPTPSDHTHSSHSYVCVSFQIYACVNMTVMHQERMEVNHAVSPLNGRFRAPSVIGALTN